MVNGIDVSVDQGAINWSSVKRAGYSFAVAKATEGAGYVDAMFLRNLDEMRAAGMISGAYHFFDWGVDPVRQADHFLSVYVPKAGDLPPMLDAEAPASWPPEFAEGQVVASVAKFLGVVEHKVGVPMLFYTGWAFASRYFRNGPFAGHPLWVAAYTDVQDIPITPGWSFPTLWQWTDTGEINGISGNVDHDRFIGTLDALHDLLLK